MKLREVKIKNFRCLVDVTIPIEDTTVLVGENNSGKTALLDALRIALPRSQMGRVTPFDEYDYFMSRIGDSPQTSEGIIIELWFREDNSSDWPNSLIQSLTDIIQTDPVRDLDSIGLRLTSIFDNISKEIVTKWEFLNLDGQPLMGRGTNFSSSSFTNYIRLFYLSALRDSDNEFSPRSQFWGRILRDLKIDENQKATLSEELSKLNDALLKADPRLEQVRLSLDKIQKVLALGAAQSTSIQPLPLQPWELMSKSEFVIKGRGSDVEFPLSRHGQGMQSLAVLFLFQAYIDVLLKPTFQPETEAILALEEPEAHLHPQATRALAANLGEVKSQKIISTHSPYFIQEIPFTQIRLFRRDNSSTKVQYVNRSYSVKIPVNQDLRTFCTNHSPKYDYVEGTSTLHLNGKMEEKEYRDLISAYPTQSDIHAEIKKLCTESQLYLSNEELSDLDNYAKRIRGEVLFARGWLLCEGQCEYMLIRQFAEMMNKPLDQSGITLIDFQNNGSPGAFVALARAFDIPWIMLCDSDEEGKKFVKQVENRGLVGQVMNELVRPLPENDTDLEIFLIKNGFFEEYKEILGDQGINLTQTQTQALQKEIETHIKRDKTGYTIRLIEKLRSSNAGAERVPEYFSRAIDDIIRKIN